MEFKDIVKMRYATKKFDGRKVPEGMFNELLELIRFSPSSYNIQPWKIIVITDEKLKKELKPAAYFQEQIDSCSHLIIFCADTDLEGLADRLGSLMEKKGVPEKSRSPYLRIIRDAFEKKQGKERIAYAQKQCYLALGNALNGAKSLGLDSCPMEGFDHGKFAEILELPDNLIPTVLCPVGYAAEKPNEKLRFDEKDVFEFR